MNERERGERDTERYTTRERHTTREREIQRERGGEIQRDVQ